MKRSELKIGQDYYHSSMREWERYGNTETHNQVTIVSLDSFSQRESGWAHYSEHEHTTSEGVTLTLPGKIITSPKKSSKVLVRRADGGLRLVSLASIRGEWEPTVAYLNDLRDQEKAAYRKLQDQRRAEKEQLEELVFLLGERGVKVAPLAWGTPQIEFEDADNVAKLIKLLKG